MARLLPAALKLRQFQKILVCMTGNYFSASIFPLAQWEPSSMVIPWCAIVGFTLLLALLIATVALLIGWREADAVIRRANAKWPLLVVKIALPLFLLCGIVVLSVLDSFPTHAWRSRTRTNLVQAVDAATGTPLPIVLYASDVPEDPYMTWGMSLRDPNTVEIEWNLTPEHLSVTSNGYEEKSFLLTASSPQLIKIPLSRSASPPTTHPYWNRFPNAPSE